MAGPGSNTVRVMHELQHADSRGLELRELRLRLPGLESTRISACLLTLLRSGHVIKPETQGGAWRLSGKPWVDGGEGQAAAPSADADPAVLVPLAERADALICKKPGGLTSIELAEALKVSVELVELALWPAVQAHHFITCYVMRQGVQGTAYRLSSGGALRFDWNAQTKSAWVNAMPRRVPAPSAPPPAPTPVAPAPLAAPPAPVSSPAPDEAPAATEPSLHATWSAASQPAEASRNPEFHGVAESAGGLVDWLQSNRPNHDVMQVVPVHETSGDDHLGKVAPDDSFLCAVYSNGALFIESHGARVTLKLAHTKRLLHYLEHMAVSDLVGAAEEARG